MDETQFRVDSLRSLMKLRPIKGSEWNVFAYVLNRDMINEDGSLDDLHGLVFPLGGFKDKESADKYASNVRKITGYNFIASVPFGFATKLSYKFTEDEFKMENLDGHGNVLQLESSQYKSEVEAYEKRLKIEKDIIEEAETETDPDSLEHFKRQVFLAIKNKAEFETFSKKSEEALAKYKMREELVKEHYNKHPEHEEQFLPFLKQKLEGRGEKELYLSIENGYNQIKNELLGLK
jgi:hypothetical protein